ncbi:hypothetical protein Ancab_028458 [Ancistrocladus abbreviatus]
MTQSSSSGTVRKHVAVCAYPFGTHAAPLLRVVQRIAATAPDIRFAFFNTQTSNAHLFSATNGRAAQAPFHNIVPHTVHDGVPEGHMLSDPVLDPIMLFHSSAEENVRKSMAEAEEEGAPWIALWAAGNAALAAYLHTDAFRSIIGVEVNGPEDVKSMGCSMKQVEDIGLDSVEDLGLDSSHFGLHSVGWASLGSIPTQFNVPEDFSGSIVAFSKKTQDQNIKQSKCPSSGKRGGCQFTPKVLKKRKSAKAKDRLSAAMHRLSYYPLTQPEGERN